MKRRYVLSVVMVALLVMAVGLRLFGPKEPSYEGVTLTEWLKLSSWRAVELGTNMSKAERLEKTRRAVKAIGTNAIPTLLALMNAKEEPIKCKILSWMGRHSVPSPHIMDTFEARYVAALGFEMLGHDALPAAPALVALMQNTDGDIRTRALQSLCAINPGKAFLLPALWQGFYDPDDEVHFFARNELRLHFPDELGLEKPASATQFRAQPSGTNYFYSPKSYK